MFVASDLGLFFERGDRRALLVPDVLVSFGVDREAPAFLQGLGGGDDTGLRAGTAFGQDVAAGRGGQAPALRTAIGVGEYWIFDPISKLPEPIVGRRLDAAGVYRTVREQPGGGYHSEVLGLDLIVHGDGLRFRDPTTGEILPDHVEAVAQRDREAAARQAAEARVAQLEERLRQR